ncbi:hypothetical protein CJD36_011675 [Flavipsychrobacter stenotrophus]|uniref:Protein BatD n=2 Tax=Flavipsychrobacter stenotrophus TaxID=2077091 RepID=A0A2S7SVJ4_9BACT|nr:hypothetical protein CJD36_011675 [Flavipsychrobacter stenotrophus]
MLSLAQGDAKVTARMDARQITVGDQARYFIEVQHNPSISKINWPVFTDTFDHLEIVEKGEIDTLKQGGMITYRQRLLITGFDSGVFKIPSFQFAIVPTTSNPYVIQTDSFQLLVQTVTVDTTKDFKPIKGIIFVQSTWRDYIWYIAGGLLLLIIVIAVTVYIVKNRKPAPPAPMAPEVPLQDRFLKKLTDLETQQLWQKNQVKTYYVELTDIVRNYVEERFNTPAMELTTDELLFKVQHHRELQPYYEQLSVILRIADLAKFAKGQPLPQEHFDAMEKAKQFIDSSRPKITITETPTEQK